MYTALLRGRHLKNKLEKDEHFALSIDILPLLGRSLPG